MLIPHKGHTDTIQVYSVTVMTHVKALQAGHSSQGTSEPITPGLHPTPNLLFQSDHAHGGTLERNHSAESGTPPPPPTLYKAKQQTAQQVQV